MNRIEWAERIGAGWRRAADEMLTSIIQTGRDLIAAKAELPHGEFEAMIGSDLPFEPATARRFMIIARDPRLTDRAHAHALPPHWGTLYELTKLDAPTFAAKVADGTIRPEIQRQEVAAIAKQVRQADRRAGYHAGVAVGCTVQDLRDLAATGYRASTIYADPPWTYETWSNKGKDRSAEQHYDTASIEEIAALPVPLLAADDSTLVLWIIETLLAEALGIIARWGFTYRTFGFTWAKQNASGEGWFMGMGHWTRGNPEVALLATRGNPKRLAADVRELVIEPVGTHSEKPGRIHGDIERLVGGPYLELYGRERRKNWHVWGNQIRRDDFWTDVRGDAHAEPS